jgi:hypothetical protein
MKVNEMSSHTKYKPCTNIIQDHLWPHEIAECYQGAKYNKYTINFDCDNAVTETDFAILTMLYWYEMNVIMEVELIIEKLTRN